MRIMSNAADHKADSSLSTGTRVAILVAVALLAVAIYYYTAPTMFLGKDGNPFGCGSPMSPNNSALGRGSCSVVEGQSAQKAYLFAGLAVVIGALGFFLFGNAGPGTGRQAGAADAREIRSERRSGLREDAETRGGYDRRSAMRTEEEADERRGSSTRERGVLLDDDADEAPRSRRAPRLGDEDFETEERPRRNRFED